MTTLSLITIGFLSITSSVQGAQLTNVRSLVSEEYDDLLEIPKKHAEAFQTLSEKYSLTKPSKEEDIMKEVRSILYGYCEDEGTAASSCMLDADSAISDATNNVKDGIVRVQYPADMDIPVKDLLNDVISAIQILEFDNLDDILRTLTQVKEDMEELKDVSHFYKQMGVAAVETAIGSTELWHTANYSNDHPLHFLFESTQEQQQQQQHLSNRDLQLSTCAPVLGGAYAIVIIADFVGIWSTIPGFMFRMLINYILYPAFIPILRRLFAPLFLAGVMFISTRFAISLAFRAIAGSAAAAAIVTMPAILLCLITTPV